MYTDILKEVEHYLSIIDGLYAADNPEFEEPFRLDCKELLNTVSREYFDDVDYWELLISNLQGKKDYTIEYGFNRFFSVKKDTPVMFKDFKVIFLNKQNTPFRVINMNSIISVNVP